ncbi:hypothetical protein, partial [Mobiluncus mulieris]|uniref:hypothetical protein n=1 Tax=Mobiluncus mulieris TaxID=2052 RepID=UPI0021E22E61
MSRELGEYAKKAGLTLSMGRTGVCWDNARACQVFCVSGVRFVILLGIFRGSLGLVLVVLSASYSR